MCGRFVQSADPGEYAHFLGAEVVVSEALAPSYNVAPTDTVYAVAAVSYTHLRAHET